MVRLQGEPKYILLHLSRNYWLHSQLDHNDIAVTFDVLNLKISNTIQKRENVIILEVILFFC